jgi:hypothetical protein
VSSKLDVDIILEWLLLSLCKGKIKKTQKHSDNNIKKPTTTSSNKDKDKDKGKKGWYSL